MNPVPLAITHVVENLNRGGLERVVIDPRPGAACGPASGRAWSACSSPVRSPAN